MSDTYQAVYDAVRSQLRNTDVGEAIKDACHLDASSAISSLQQDFFNVSQEMRRPSVLYRPRLSIDGDQWCALYGANLQEGVDGFGESPSLAMCAFDRAWEEKIALKAEKHAEVLP